MRRRRHRRPAHVLCHKLKKRARAPRRSAKPQPALSRWPSGRALAEPMRVERPSELLERILDESGLAEYYQQDRREPMRVENLKQLVASATIRRSLLPCEMATESRRKRHSRPDLDRQAPRRQALHRTPPGQGLEFPVVFVAMAIDDNSPAHAETRRPPQRRAPPVLRPVSRAKAASSFLVRRDSAAPHHPQAAISPSQNLDARPEQPPEAGPVPSD